MAINRAETSETVALENLFTALDDIDEALEDGPQLGETPGQFKTRALSLTKDFERALNALSDEDIAVEYGETTETA